MDLSIIIVSHNTKDVLLNCIRSIYKSPDNLKKEIIVIDNHSTDGTVELLRNHFKDIKLIQNQMNVGFAAANNQGATQATGEFILLLNSDTLVINDALSKLVKSAKESQATILSCQLLNSDHTIQPQGGKLPTLFNLTAWMTFFDDLPIIKSFFPSYQIRRESYFEKDQQPGWVGGTAMLINANVYHKLNGLDEDLFMYAEDVEFCYRAYQNKHQIRYFSEPRIIHLGQQSGSPQKAIIGEFQGLKHLYAKHKPSWQQTFLRLILKTGALLRVFVFGIIRGDHERKVAYQQAYRLA